ncbi:electron transfer flavoprotein subunit beta [Desulfocarbo indianensis]|nr:electron transfer flavoprotein subunit beta [Desulfocarbo indianensis]
MNIAVLVKQVPDTNEIKLDPKTGTLIREGVESIMNPDDRLGLETALMLKDAHGAKVTVISMGPPQAIDVITEAMAMGADGGVLLSDRNFAGADTWATSYTLGKALEKLLAETRLDLVIAGRQAIDGDTAQIGPQVAEHLGWPQVTYVSELKLEDGSLRAWRKLPGGVEEVVCPLPAVVTVLDAPQDPRWAMVDRLLWACGPKSPIRVWDAADIEAPAKSTGLRGSLTQVMQTFSPKSERKTDWIEGTAEEQARHLVNALSQRNLI